MPFASSRLVSLCVLLLAMSWSSLAHAEDLSLSRPAALLGRAQQFTLEKPSATWILGTLRLASTFGKEGDAVDQARLFASLPAGDPQSPLVREWICWRMMPAGYANREPFRRQVEAMGDAAADAGSSFLIRLYLATLDRDRQAMLKLASAHGNILSLSSLADRAAFDLLIALGIPKTEAALHVLSHRQFDSLFALADLDRSLTREITYLRGIDRTEDADKLAACRDRLRNDYLASSTHIVERAFALGLLDRTAERDALLARQAVFHEQVQMRGGLEAIVHRIDPNELWPQFLEPMLAGDITLLDHPPRWLTAAQPVDFTTRLRIEAGKRETRDGVTHYTGEVVLTLGDARITSDVMTLARTTDAAGQPGATVSGQGRLQLSLAGCTISANRFTLTTQPMSIVATEDVKVQWRSPSTLGTRFTQAAFTHGGQLVTARTFTDDWKDAKNLSAQFAMLAKLPDDAEIALLDEAKFLLALKLVEPHLTWHAPWLPPADPQNGKWRRQSQLEKQVGADAEQDWRWSQALGREPWMTIPQQVIDQCKAILAKSADKQNGPRGEKEPEPADLCFWRLKDPQHADVARAMELLTSIKDQPWRASARRWAAELARNNTVLTFDIPGAFPAGLDGPLVMDVRSADEVTFNLYRVRQPADLLRVIRQIGVDFIFRDHGLQIDEQLQPADLIHRLQEQQDVRLLRVDDRMPLPTWTEQDRVETWTVRVADLPQVNPTGDWNDWRIDFLDEDNDDAGWFFGDQNDAYRARLARQYRPERNAAGSWRTDRMVKIPAKSLTKAGGYVLVASANGATAQMPILVDPLSLTLRRSRDGVLVVAADASGRFPVVGAEVSAPQALKPETTDRRGVAFLRVHAAGDRPILVHKEGRYAIGGFGRVFDGIYRRVGDEFDFPVLERLAKEQRKLREEEPLAQVYDDRFVIAAITDRPTYRPGQLVQFKLIMRELAVQSPTAGGANAPAFRAEDFDFASRLVVPKQDAPLRWELLNPAGREVASGNATLNDFGTAVGEANLNEESSIGRYSLRVTAGGQARVVPDVLAVKHYRRPNVELKVEGVPALVTKTVALPLQVAANYYFGTPVTEGAIEVRLVHAEQWKPLAQVSARLDVNGHAKVELPLPRQLASGKYAVLTTLTDGSGRSVSRTDALDFRGEGAIAGTSNLPSLPRFVAVGQDLIVRTPRGQVTATVSEGAANIDQVFLAKEGAATIKISRAGWHRIQTGEEHADVFAYGTEESAIASLPPWESAESAGEDEQVRWVNLTDFSQQEQTGFNRLDDPRSQLHAMFERHHALVGDTLRVLVYCPVNQPRLLLTIEGRTVIDYIDVTVDAKAGRYHVIEIPIKKHYGPNFYLQGRILGWARTSEQPRREKSEKKQREKELEDVAEDESQDPRWCRVDVIDPQRQATGEQLNVEIKTAQTDYKPGENVDVRILVTDLAGKPREAELSLAAVDESVFTFGESATGSHASLLGSPMIERRYEPKAWRSSVGIRWSREEIERLRAEPRIQRLQMLEKAMEAMKSARAAEASSQSLAVVEGMAAQRAVTFASLAGKLPVTSMPLLNVRKDFRETATWQPQVRTDANGQAQATFKLPDSLTSYRLTAIGVTRGTEIGSGRSQIRAALPLSVQVFLPRFAVENDELEAKALIHNGEDQPRTCTIRWEISGGGSAAVNEGWKRTEAAGRAVYESEVMVAGRRSTAVALRLLFDRVGEVRAVCRVTDRERPQVADVEERTLRVAPLGRPMQQAFSGVFEGEHRIQLPAGFTASDLKVTVSRHDVAHALEGLGYLVEYPYGCVEQTMSRFLPAVMVQHAVKRSAITLAPEIEAKMPDVLAKGLERLYTFQHEDGSFGWFARDARDDAMTIYVMYGLARCHSVGATVDVEVLRRGCHFLTQRLQAGSMTPSDRARAWLVLALAGKAAKVDLEEAAVATLKSDAQGSADVTPEVMVNLALACREAGLREHAARLWKSARHWDAKSAAHLSLKLCGQSAFGEPVEDCQATARRLLDLRQGDRWAHTRDTSWALEAMTELVGYAPPAKGSAALMIEVAGRRVLDRQKDDAGATAVERVVLRGDQCPAVAGAQILLKSGDAGAFRFSITAGGVERLDHATPHGDAVKLTRRFERLDGKVITGPVKAGEVIAVRLSVELAKDQSYVIVEDARPAGLEFADDQLRVVRGPVGGTATPSAVEFRDDRLCIFFGQLAAGRHEMLFFLRAEAAGISHVLPGVVYPMYADTLRGETGTQRLEVVH